MAFVVPVHEPSLSCALYVVGAGGDPLPLNIEHRVLKNQHFNTQSETLTITNT